MGIHTTLDCPTSGSYHGVPGVVPLVLCATDNTPGPSRTEPKERRRLPSIFAASCESDIKLLNRSDLGAKQRLTYSTCGKPGSGSIKMSVL